MHHRSSSILIRLLRHDPNSSVQSARAALQRRDSRGRSRTTLSQQKRWHSAELSSILRSPITVEATDNNSNDIEDYAFRQEKGDALREIDAVRVKEYHDMLQRFKSEDCAVEEDQWAVAMAKTDVAMEEVDYKVQLPLAISRQEPDLAIRCLFAADQAGDGDFIQSITDHEFTSILKLIAPSRWLADLFDVHKSVKSAVVNARGLVPVDQVARDFGSILIKALAIRRRYGGKLLITDYELVLAAAKTLRLALLADKVWELVQQDGLSLTTKCFNGYVAAKGYVRPVGTTTSQKERVTPVSLKYRASGWLRWYFAYAVGSDGIKEITDRYFSHMQKLGLHPDVESYCNVILACAYEGDVESVAGILNQIWGVDISALRHGQRPRRPDAFEEGNSLRPNQEFLYAATKSFLINNDLPTALRLMSYLCEHYKIEASPSQWSMMLEWTHVLSVPRTPAAEQNGQAAGQVDPGVMYAIWRTMTSPPNNVRPHLGMYDFLIRNLWKQDHSIEARARMLDAMKEGLTLYEEGLQMQAKTRRELFKLLAVEDSENISLSPLPRHSIENASRQYELAQLTVVRNRELLQAWCHYYLQNAEVYAQGDFDAQLTAVDIPLFIERFYRTIGRTVSYGTPTGWVQFDLRTAQERQDFADKSMAMRKQRQDLMTGRTRVIDGTWYNGSMDRAWDNNFLHTRTTHMDHLHKMYRGFRRPEHVPDDVNQDFDNQGLYPEEEYDVSLAQTTPWTDYLAAQEAEIDSHSEENEANDDRRPNL